MPATTSALHAVRTVQAATYITQYIIPGSLPGPQSPCIPPAMHADYALRSSSSASQEINSQACLPHLPTWPHLQALLLRDVHPTSIKAEHVALLAAAPSLKRLVFSRSAAEREEERQRMEVRWIGRGAAAGGVRMAGGLLLWPGGGRQLAAEGGCCLRALLGRYGWQAGRLADPLHVSPTAAGAAAGAAWLHGGHLLKGLMALRCKAAGSEQQEGRTACTSA